MTTMLPTKTAARNTALGLLTTALLLGGFLLPACSATEGESDGGSDEVLARVNGQPITEADVEEASSNELSQAEAQLVQCQTNYERSRYQIVERGVQSLVEERLIEAEAERRGVSKEELVKSEVEDAVAEVTDADVDTWFQENQGRLRGTKEQLAPQIKQFLAQQKQQEVRTAFLDSIREGAEVKYFLNPPRVEVAADGPAIGPADAPVTIVEFSDFECPFCSRVVPTIKQVEEKYGDKVRIVFRQFPLAMHPNAPKAAEASLCAHEQDKFWAMHDLLFENQQKLTVDDLKAHAETLELDTAAFNECLDSGRHADQVAQDMQDGQKVGVSGTPATFINGRLISGAQPFESFAEIIEMELARGEG